MRWPTSGARWLALLSYLAGGLVGWAVFPVLWAVAGPFRWMALLWMTAAQESGYNPEAAGDNGDSVGIAQFNVKSWPSLTGDRDLADRTSPFLSGFYSARYVALALYTSWDWWALALPVYGPAVMRWMWTHGISASSAATATTEGYTAYQAEGASSGTWWTVRTAMLLPAAVSLAVLAGVARAVAKRWRR